MSHRLQVLIPQQLHRRIAKAAQRQRISIGELVRRALGAELRTSARVAEGRDALDRLASLDGPTGDLEEMLAEIGGSRA